MATIVSTPDVLGGKPRIEGTRIGVLDVTELLAGSSPEQVSEELGVSLAAVEAARRYAREHPEEIAEWRAKRREFHDQLREETTRSA